MAIFPVCASKAFGGGPKEEYDEVVSFFRGELDERYQLKPGRGGESALEGALDNFERMFQEYRQMTA